MAERVNFIPETEDTSDDDSSSETSTSKKKSKKSAEKIGAALIDKSETSKAERPLEKLRGLFAEKPEKSTENTTAENVLRKLSDEALESTPLAEWRELAPDELAGGEVIIELHGEKTDSSQLYRDEEAPFVAPLESIDGSGSYETEEDDTSPPATHSGASPGTGSGSGGTGRGASGGGIPPRSPHVSSSSYPPSPRRRTTSTTNRALSPLPPTGASFNQLLAAQQATDEAWHQGRGRGRREGLLAGLLVGGGIEHFRHKSREKKMEKTSKTEKQKQEKAFELEKQDLTRRATKDRLEYEQRLHAEVEATLVARTSEAAATTKAIAAEKIKADTEKEKAKQIERLNAQAAEQERLQAEALLKDPEHRIETSAWHAMEVDKSGHIVEDSTIEYGHEYYRERAHETGPKDQLDAKAGSAAVAAAMFAGGGTNQQPPSDTSLSTPTGRTESSSVMTTGLPPIAGIEADDYDGASTHVSATAIIPWLVVLALIVIAIVTLL